jgi:hypothetical protein
MSNPVSNGSTSTEKGDSITVIQRCELDHVSHPRVVRLATDGDGRLNSFILNNIPTIVNHHFPANASLPRPSHVNTDERWTESAKRHRHDIALRLIDIATTAPL